MSQQDMLQNQVFEELLRERITYYYSKKKNPNFWISINPNFLLSTDIRQKVENSDFYFQHQSEINFNNKFNFYSVLLSSDLTFIQWLKLRIGYFEDMDSILDKKEKRYSSDGIFGVIYKNDNSQILQYIRSNSNFIHPEIKMKKFEKTLELYYESIQNKI